LPRTAHRRFQAAGLVLSLVLLAASPGCIGTKLPEGVARHVVVISIDTARADHFGFMGSRMVRTPGLDRFAGESIVFTDYMTVVPTTLASHTSLFTGKYPLHHGTARNGFIVNDENVMLAEVLKSAGFRTAAFVGSFALDSRFGFAQGFDHYDEEFDILVGDRGADQNQRRAGQVTDAVIRYLDDAGVPDRLFLFAHYFDPHAPYAAPPPYDTMYDPLGSEGLLPALAVKRSPDLTADERREAIRRLAMAYASEISYTDEHVSRLLEDLRGRGILDDAVVVITSDHGECMWEHGEEFDHGRTVYQATMHALCVMRLPHGELGGTRVDELVANIDVMPTVLRLAGLEPPEGIDGEPIPLRPDEGGIRSRARFGEATKPRSSAETDPRWTNIRKARCIREGRYKFISTPYLGREEMYDVVADPRETKELLGAAPDTSGPSDETLALAAEMRARLAAWTDSARPLPSRFDSSQTEESIRRLRSLGYLN